MKQLFMIISMLFSQILLAQDTLRYKPFVYRIGVNTIDNNKAMDGYLNSLTDTSISISRNAVRLGSYPGSPSRSTEISFQNIDLLILKRTGGAGRGALVGSIAGALTGAIAGFAGGDDPKEGWQFFQLTAGQKAVIFGGLAGFTGAVVGTLVGAVVQQTFLVKGRKDKFDEFRMSVAR